MQHLWKAMALLAFCRHGGVGLLICWGRAKLLLVLASWGPRRPHLKYMRDSPCLCLTALGGLRKEVWLPESSPATNTAPCGVSLRPARAVGAAWA